jgi:transcriptional regulator with XRE-family HTH domain
MKLCIDYLREIEAKHGWSRFRIAKELGLTSSRMYQLFDHGGTYNDETAFKVAQLLEIDPAVVMAAAAAERTKNPEIQAVWTGLLEKISEGFETLLSGASPRRIRLPAC